MSACNNAFEPYSRKAVRDMNDKSRAARAEALTCPLDLVDIGMRLPRRVKTGCGSSTASHPRRHNGAAPAQSIMSAHRFDSSWIGRELQHYTKWVESNIFQPVFTAVCETIGTLREIYTAAPSRSARGHSLLAVFDPSLRLLTN